MNNIKIAVENANSCGKIWDMHTLLEYAKKAAISKICGNHIFIVHLRTIQETLCKVHTQHFRDTVTPVSTL